jgi:hypothetical protein
MLDEPTSHLALFVRGPRDEPCRSPLAAQSIVAAALGASMPTLIETLAMKEAGARRLAKALARATQEAERANEERLPAHAATQRGWERAA